MKTNLHSIFKTDESLEKEGVVVDYGTAKFKISRMGGANSAKIKAAHTKHVKPFTGALRSGGLSEAKLREVDIKTFIDTCLISWEGVKDEQEKDIPFSFENAVVLFTELPELFVDLGSRASSADTFKSDVGNS